ncbi:urokinase-type plasminogen activator-like [Aulostomus maculatus]
MNLLVILAIFAAVSIEVALSKRKKWSPTLRDTQTARCRSGDGSSYRGLISETVYGARCLNWNRFKNLWGASKGLGDHNYCRNPDNSLMPWCRVRRGSRVVKEFCDVPKCSATAADSEMTCGERSERKMHKIVGGSFTPIQSQPWVAAIFHQRHNFLCGASLIAPCWVLTAAHCFSDGEATNIKRLSVYLGKSTINDTDSVKEQKFRVEKMILHPKYNESNYNNDIALLKIKSRDGGCAVRSASVRTVCLPPPRTQLPAGFQCSIAGYGRERYGALRYSQFLKQAQVNLLSMTDCRGEPQYDSLITDNMICAASPDWSRDACKGDSGGPLVCEVSGRMFLFGVVSWGISCAQENNPGVYTQVTKYNKWIAEKSGLPKYTIGVMYPTK